MASCRVAPTSENFSYTGNKMARDNLEPSGNLSVGCWETCQWSVLGADPWEAVGCVMFRPARHWPSLRSGSERKMGPLIPSVFLFGYPSAPGGSIQPTTISGLRVGLDVRLSCPSAFLHNCCDGRSLHTQTSLTELTIMKRKKEQKEEKAAFC